MRCNVVAIMCPANVVGRRSRVISRSRGGTAFRANYFQAKKAALAVWASYLGSIINPTIASTNVTALHGR